MTVEPLPLYGQAQSAHVSRRSGWAGGLAGTAIAFLVCLAPPFGMGQTIEERTFPIFSYQAIPSASVTRIDRTLCWDWIRDKVRTPELLDLDVRLDTGNGDTFAPEIYDPANGIPWHKGGALPAGHYETRFCTSIPPNVGLDVPVRLRQTIKYDGFLGLWTLTVPMPAIIVN